MATIIPEVISKNIETFIVENSDPRAAHRWLMSSPLPTFYLIGGYLVLVLYILPWYMQHKPAYQLKTVLLYYNLFQVVLSAYIVYLCYGSGFVRKYSLFSCRDLDFSTTDPDSLMAMNGIYLYYLSKFTEFIDTILFVLRKKTNQVSFLHVYHHATMPFNAWLGAKFTPGGTATLGAGINAMVHVVMYTYYLLAALGPSWQKYVWWKKYLTTFQIIQFIYGISQLILVYLTKENCPLFMKRYPIMIYGGMYIVSLLVLFYRFYYKCYNKQNTNGIENKSK